MNNSSEYIPYELRPETYIVPALFFFIFVVGVLGNGTLVVIFTKHQSMRTIPNTYIFSLALADLLVIITCVPFTSIIFTVEYWPWGELVCKLSEFVKDISIGVSVFTLTALSAERYSAIVNPMKRFQTKSITVIVAVMIWIVAIGLALPNVIVARIELREISDDHNEFIEVCSPFPEFPINYDRYSVIAKTIIYYLVPLIIIATFYILMAITLHRSAHDMPGEMRSEQGAKSRRQVARMVLIFVFLFFLCYLPYHIQILWFKLDRNSEANFNEFWNVVKITGFCLSFFNSCVNPIALYCVSGVFRTYFNHYLFCQNMQRRSTQSFSGGSTRMTTSS